MIQDLFRNINELVFQPVPEGLVHPALTICSRSGFKTNSSVNDLHTNLSWYLEDTFALEELVVDVNDGFYSNASTVDEVTATYSKYRGRCYTSYSEKKVRDTHAIFNGKIVNAVS